MTEPTTEVPQEAQAQLRAAVDTALSKPQQAQGFLSSIPDLSGVGGAKDKILEVLTKIVGALDVVETYAWLIPDQYEAPLAKLKDALVKVQGWLD